MAYDVYGAGEPTILLLPTWSIVHSRIWKLQIPFLARHRRVVAFDPRGNGRSDRPMTAAGYGEPEYAADALAVMDATGTERAVLVSLSIGAQRSLLIASDHPERVVGAVFIAPSLPMASPVRRRAALRAFLRRPDTDGASAWFNQHAWRRDYPGFLEYFFGACFSEAHSTRPIEDAVAWGLETDPESLILSQLGPRLTGREDVLARAARVRCPVMVIHGTDDQIRPYADGRELAAATGGQLVSVAGGGHIPNVRDPVTINLLIRDFVRHVGSTRRIGPGR
jgi:pimeloyl-ACP methyl ester carboxylesterase